MMPFALKPADSLTIRLMAIASVLVCAVMLAVAAAADWSGTRTVGRLASDYAAALARETATELSVLYDQQFQSITLLPVTIKSRAARPTAALRAVEDLGHHVLEQVPEIQQLWILPTPETVDAVARVDSRPGTPSASGAPPGSEMVVLSWNGGRIERTSLLGEHERAATRKAVETGRSHVHIPPASDGGTAGTPLTTRTEPVFHAGRIVGVVGYVLRPADWIKVGDAVRRPVAGTHLSVVTRNGRFAYDDDLSLVGHAVAAGDGGLNQLTEAEQQAVKAGLPFSAIRAMGPAAKVYHRVGVPLTSTYGDHATVLIMDIPRAPLLEPARSGDDVLWLACAGGAAILLLGLGLLLARLAVAPLEHLRDSLQRLNAGEHDQAIPLTERPDQIGDIARALAGLRRSVMERSELADMLIRSAQDMERMIAAIDAAMDMVVVMDAGHRILYANVAAADLVGAPDADAVVGKTWTSLLDPASVSALSDLGMFETLDQTGRWDGAIEDYRTIFGRTVAAMETRLTRLPNGDVVMVGRDLSARREAEREKVDLERRLSQMDKMDAVGRLAGGIAHDFNNLLGAISGYASFLASDLAPHLPQHDYARRILTVCDRAKEMVKQILLFSRAGTTERTPVAPRLILTDARMFLRPSIPTTVSLSFTPADGLPNVLANATQIVQVLVNLVINARDAIPGETGKIFVSAALWDGASDPAGDCEAGWTVHRILPPHPAATHVTFDVRDTGGGIADDIVASIFEPFFTTKDPSKGTGLGLAVVLGIVQAHDGGLVVCSGKGQGTLVRIFIPATAQGDAETAAASPAAVAARPPVRCRVLVVDDEQVMGDIMSIGLERLGHEVAVCESPAEALDIFDEEPGTFDAVVTDQTMPGMSGIALIEQLKQRRPDLPCILYTGFSTVVDEAVARSAGADGFFLKPVKIATLAEAIERLVQKHKNSLMEQSP